MSFEEEEEDYVETTGNFLGRPKYQLIIESC
jgi:hypothetical protein